MAILFPSILLMKGRHKAVRAKNAPLQLNFFWHPGFKWLLLWAFLTSECWVQRSKSLTTK